ncbi:MAG: rod-binding protein [Deltaproteobacteria bacterium]|jgi:flagellar protein FlgJ|nr:rod-binding protein [Deltaproteobacteria bacterium]
MADFVSSPKLPFNIADMVVEAPTRLQRALHSKKGATGVPANDSELAETCRQMESLFINQLFKEMRATIHRSGFFSGGRAEEIYTSMMDAEMAVKLANRGGIGLADMMLHQLDTPASAPGAEKSGDPE